MSRWVKYIALGLAIIIGGTAVYIEINSERIAQRLVSMANESLKKPLQVGDYDVSFLSTFPAITVSLHKVTIDDLLHTEAIRARINIVEIIRNRQSGLRVERLSIHDGQISLVSTANGDTNYDILKDNQQTDSGASEFVNINLRSYEIDRVDIRYRDDRSHQNMSIQSLSASGDLSVTKDHMDISSTLSANTSLPTIDVPLSLSGDLIVRAQNDGSTYHIRKGDIVINKLPISAGGNAHNHGDSWSYNLDLSSPSSDVKDLLSILPNVNNNQYADAISKGTFKAIGNLSGNTANSYPTYDISINIDNGGLRYPGFSKAIDNISIDATAKNTNANKPYTTIHVKDMAIEIADSKLSGTLLLDSSTDDIAAIDAQANINLADIHDAMIWPSIESMTGQISGDVQTKFGLISKETQTLSTDLSVSEISILHKDNGKAYLRSASITGDEKQIKLDADDLGIPGMSIHNVALSIDDLLASIEDGSPIRGSLQSHIGHLYMSEFSNTDTISTTSSPRAIPQLDIIANVQVDEIVFKPYHMYGVSGSGNLSSEVSKISYGIESINGQKLSGSAQLDSLMDFLIAEGALTGTIEVKSPSFVLDSIMTTADSDPSGDNLMLDRIRLDILYASDHLQYKGINLTNTVGTIGVKGKTIRLENNSNILNGAITAVAALDLSDASHPHVLLNADLNEVSFSETARQIASFSQLLPIAPLLRGEYTTTINWDSDLSADFLPLLESLTAFGRLRASDGAMMTLPALDSMLYLTGLSQISAPSIWTLDNVSRYFKIENGRVIVPQMKLSHRGIDYLYSGSHGFDQRIDYDVSSIIPKERLDLSKLIKLLPAGLSSSDFLNRLTDGMDLELVMRWTGYIYRPQIKITDLRLRKGSISESIKSTIKDEITKQTTQVKDTIESILDTAQDTLAHLENEANKAIDSVKAIAQTEWDSTKVAVEETAQTILDSLMVGNIDSIGKEVEDLMKRQKIRLSDLDKLFKKKKKLTKPKN